jgi:hypothetical protein
VLALAYMLCVLAPGIAFAFGQGALAAPCLTNEDHALGVVHNHESGMRAVQHVHQDGHGQEHSDGPAQVAHPADMKAADAQTPPPAGGEHKAFGTQCCGMVCISALPVTVVEVAKPSAPTSRCAFDVYRRVTDNAPPRLYRPPIS